MREGGKERNTGREGNRESGRRERGREEEKERKREREGCSKQTQRWLIQSWVGHVT